MPILRPPADRRPGSSRALGHSNWIGRSSLQCDGIADDGVVAARPNPPASPAGDTDIPSVRSGTAGFSGISETLGSLAESFADADPEADAERRRALRRMKLVALGFLFAVTALFKHPLGIPIPHTAIIPRKKDQLGDALGTFVRENFLSPQVVETKL